MVGLGLPNPSEKHTEQHDLAEAERHFEAALRGARLAPAKTMKEIVGKRATGSAKSRVKKRSLKQSQKRLSFASPRRRRLRVIGSLIGTLVHG